MAEGRALRDGADAREVRTVVNELVRKAVSASEGGEGLVALASDDETLALAADTVAVTPGNLGALAAGPEQRGIAETATNAEAQAKADTGRMLTPANLAALGASDTFAGLVELATSAETVAGTDAARAVTPAGLQAKAASATAIGLVELATSAETITGTDATRAVTPAGLQAKVASATALGLVELATDAETVSGTDATRAVTPAGLQAKVASMSAPGLVELANDTEAQAMADTTRALTPSNLATLVAVDAEMVAATDLDVFVCPGSQHRHPGHPKAYALFDTSSGTPTLSYSYNVASLTDLGTGLTDVNFTTSMSAHANVGAYLVSSNASVTQLSGVSSNAHRIRIQTRDSAFAAVDASRVGGVAWGHQ